MAKRVTAKSTITVGEHAGHPVLRLYLSQTQKDKLLLMKGKQPKDLFTIIIL